MRDDEGIQTNVIYESRKFAGNSEVKSDNALQHNNSDSSENYPSCVLFCLYYSINSFIDTSPSKVTTEL